MASYGTNYRPIASSTTSASKADQPDESKDSTRKNRNNFKLLCPYNIPLTPEAAAVRIIRNLRYFGLYYILFVWIILFISLVPKRKVSLIFLVAMTVVTCFYLILLRALPNSVVLHQVIDRRLVLALLAIVTVVELILTRAAIHLGVTLACGIPIILVHAILRVTDDLFVGEEACAAGELVPLVGVKTRDVIILVHAILRVTDDLFVGEEACAAGELVPLVGVKTRDVIILVHAILRVMDDLFVGEEACAAGGLVPLVGVKTGDVESNSAASV